MIAKPDENTRSILRVERAMEALRRGEAVLMENSQKPQVVWVVSPETTPEPVIADIMKRAKDVRWVITPVRARRLGYEAIGNQPVAIRSDWRAALVAIDPIRKVKPAGLEFEISSCPIDEAALQLAKLSALLPAALVIPAEGVDADAIQVKNSDVMQYRHMHALSLKKVSEAKVPLVDAADARVIAFRADGSPVEHLAVAVGSPESEAAPLVRLHSSCVTGDILGSLRCDCGEQLKAALAAMSKAGAGVLLYLNQEGRGIGIANKLRAYTLQDSGLDTVEANEEIGFDADERYFLAAVSMLKLMGIKTIRLMTNNPHKVTELERLGITVKERVPLVMAANAVNARYLDTKAKKCGHLM